MRIELSVGVTTIKSRLRNIFIVMAVMVLVPVLLLGYAIVMVTTIEIKTDKVNTQLPRIEDVPRKYWSELSEKKIFFIHKDLGDEIIDGMKALVKEHDYIRLNIVETTDPCAFDRPIVAHAKIGRCMNPDSKTSGFEDALDSGIGEKADITFIKFCHMDVIWQSDAQIVFDSYRKMVEELKDRYPRMKLLHVTVPICSKPARSRKILRETIKLLIGRPSIFDDNLRRQQYNTLLHNAYSQTESIFDLALAESINPDYMSCYTTLRGIEKVLVKAPQYTIGGSRLNAEGKKIIAEQLLITLARIASE